MYKVEYIVKRPSLDVVFYQHSEERTIEHKNASQIFHDWLKTKEDVECHSSFSSDGLTYKWTMVFDDEDHYESYEKDFMSFLSQEPFNGKPVTAFDCIKKYEAMHGIVSNTDKITDLAPTFEV